jgi:hypothetical protein
VGKNLKTGSLSLAGSGGDGVCVSPGRTGITKMSKGEHHEQQHH